MAIFSNSNIELENNKADSNTTIITAGAKLKGTLEFSCNLYIDGELEGELHSEKDVNIGKNGKLKGSIYANRVVVQGHMEGIVDAQKVEIKAGGHFEGEIISSELIIESKGIFEGSSSVKNTNIQALENITEEKE